MLIPCPACKKQISDTAPACPQCGHTLTAADKEYLVNRASAQNQKIAQTEKSCLAGCLIFILLSIIIGLISYVTTPKTVPNSTGYVSPDDPQVQAASEDLVRRLNTLQADRDAIATRRFGQTYNNIPHEQRMEVDKERRGE